ncbi:hypothetical protein [Chryseobacterium carnipullorum]|uniref:hypothetical protein n=1 Tax=Chryseobacterium carnipullorum TaxID=1124835 RepID=UPI0029391E00|nr:hypothetical protein [Chryseobacterium carnipullorum]
MSSLNYSGDSIIERIPDADSPEITQQIYFIKDSLCYTIENENPGKIILSDIIKKQKSLPVEKKKGGTLFSQEKIPNYRNRKNLSDTILFKKNTNDLKSIHLGCTPGFTFIQQILFYHIPFTNTRKRTTTEGSKGLILIIKRRTYS